MKIEKTPLKDCFVLTPNVFYDERGAFCETFNEAAFIKNTGIKTPFIQDNQSTSTRGVLRGLHFQKGEMAQAKLVRAIVGEVLDVVIDIRRDSPTFGKQYSILLSGKNHKQLYVPRGFAHGFITLSPTSTFGYKCDNYYDKSSESGIIYNDATLQIDWHLKEEQLIVSEKDLQLPSFEEATA
ncbi:dTDP-4-dehydrorhamnose 3,5-epimerase [Patiriisocius hiemis]|uniref:dTDP-4-dehydrorhamnose 3,5-epimerase n=1 Tax=Patiriisocius hiemis TaxID=3075604 RepID=A0ABU2YBL3_9FLAO|nr:dTDP-4-dehydrorhamnose 3,5-epimerase [Constantimarinum sp. W242]MDT0555573.1 dTDP-4-dehydrorhamnose 3,5-epimerase [Constantimarinum sp. W242]